MADTPEVKLKEITVSASTGAKVQVVQYQYSEDVHFSMSQKYDVQGMDDPAEQEAFRAEKIKELKYQLDGLAQEEVDRLTLMRDELRAGKTTEEYT